MLFSVTIFGALVSLIYISYFFFLLKRNTSITIINVIKLGLYFTLFFDASIFGYIGNIEVRTIEFTFYFSALYAVMKLLINFREYKYTRWIMHSFIFILLNLSTLYFFQSNIESVTLPNLWYDYFIFGVSQVPQLNPTVIVYSTYFILSIVILIVFFNEYRSFNEDIGLKYIMLLFRTLILIFAFELIIKMFFGSDIFYDFRNFIMGSNSDAVDSILRGGVLTYFGFSSEPASLAHTIFIVDMLLSSLIHEKRKLVIYSVISLILLVLTGSLLGLVYILLSIIQIFYKYRIEIIKSIKLNKFKSFIVLFSLIIISIFFVNNSNLFSYFLKRLNNVAKIISGETLEYSSEVSRITSSVLMIRVFFSRPFFGAGIGTTYGFSGLLSFLSNIGIVGFFVFFQPIIKFVKEKVEINCLVFHLIILIIILTIQGNINLFMFTQFYGYLFILLSCEGDSEYV